MGSAYMSKTVDSLSGNNNLVERRREGFVSRVYKKYRLDVL